MCVIYSIEGNIGSGKSTLVRIMKDYFKDTEGIIFADEPVDDWMNIKDSTGEDILTKFYNDQHKYGFPFQMMAYISRIAILKKLVKENPNAIIFTERSVYTDKMVFAQMLHDEGKIGEVEFAIYNQWFNNFLDEIDINGTIYIKTDPSKCFERIIKRNRKGETIPVEYLELCHTYHEDWLKNSKNTITFDGNIDMEETIDSYSDMIKEITMHVI